MNSSITSIKNRESIENQQRYSKFSNKKGNIMSKAIQDYKDEMLTGLTEDERKLIETEIRTYLKENKEKGKIDKKALDNLIKDLLRKYGFKGNREEFEGAVIGMSDGEFAYRESMEKTEAIKVNLFNNNKKYSL